MPRVWAVLTRDLAKAGPFIIGSHQALLLVMCWKMGSNVVICFMLPALLCSKHRLLKHTHTHTHHIQYMQIEVCPVDEIYVPSVHALN